MTDQILDYDDDRFAVRARELVAARQPFVVRLVGEARKQLEVHISGGVVAEPSRLGLKPKLQLLLAIMMLADVEEQAVMFEVRDTEIDMRVRPRGS